MSSSKQCPGQTWCLALLLSFSTTSTFFHGFFYFILFYFLESSQTTPQLRQIFFIYQASCCLDDSYQKGGANKVFCSKARFQRASQWKGASVLCVTESAVSLVPALSAMSNSFLFLSQLGLSISSQEVHSNSNISILSVEAG